MDVAENIWVGRAAQSRGFVDRRRLERARPRRTSADYGFESALPTNLHGRHSSRRPSASWSRSCGPSRRDVRVLALDEPTSSLTDEEVDRLFTLVRRLRDDGVAIIYVSHRIREILRLADRVAILRDGRLVAVRPAAELTEREIVRLMVGRELSDVFLRRRAATDHDRPAR